MRAMALRGFSAKKDMAAGPVILEALTCEQTNEGFKIAVMQSMSALTGKSWNYNLHEWGLGSKENREAVERFKAWLVAQRDGGRPGRGMARGKRSRKKKRLSRLAASTCGRFPLPIACRLWPTRYRTVK